MYARKNSVRILFRGLISIILTFLIAVPPSFCSDDSDIQMKLLPESNGNGRLSGFVSHPVHTSADEYVLKPGDSIMITDRTFEEGEVPASTVTETILPDGTISVYPIGIIRAAGLTVGELNKFIEMEAGKLIKHPAIDVVVTSINQIGVYVRGEVEHPGLYAPASPPTDASSSVGSASSGGGGGKSGGGGAGGGSKSSGGGGGGSSGGASTLFTVSCAIREAGGLKPDSDFHHISVTDPHNSLIRVVDLWKAMVEGNTTEDVILQSGDSVYVPPGAPHSMPILKTLGLEARVPARVQVWGAVKTPGMYEVSPYDTLLAAISVAGGPAEDASRKVILARTNQDGSITKTTFSLSQAIADPHSPGQYLAQNGDLVIVKVSAAKRISGKLAVTLLALGATIVYLTLYKAIPNPPTRGSSSSTTPSTQAVLF